MGYVSGAMKDIIKGKTPKQVFADGEIKYKTVMEAMMRGGALGIYGDFLLSETGKYKHTDMIGLTAGPAIGELQTLMNLLKDSPNALDGDDRAQYAKSWVRFISGNTPFANLFYIKPAMDYMLWRQLQETIEPNSVAKSRRKSEKRMNRDYGQEFYID